MFLVAPKTGTGRHAVWRADGIAQQCHTMHAYDHSIGLLIKQGKTNHNAWRGPQGMAHALQDSPQSRPSRWASLPSALWLSLWPMSPSLPGQPLQVMMHDCQLQPCKFCTRPSMPRHSWWSLSRSESGLYQACYMLMLSFAVL